MDFWGAFHDMGALVPHTSALRFAFPDASQGE
jgi:hypothetical protein